MLLPFKTHQLQKSRANRPAAARRPRGGRPAQKTVGVWAGTQKRAIDPYNMGPCSPLSHFPNGKSLYHWPAKYKAYLGPPSPCFSSFARGGRSPTADQLVFTRHSLGASDDVMMSALLCANHGLRGLSSKTSEQQLKPGMEELKWRAL